MRVSIIIPAFNEERLLGATLASVRAAASAFTRRGWDTELIVCDNNSTDRTAAVAQEGGATVVFEPVNQIARARNRGAAAARGEWLVFVDADSHPSEALLNDVAEQVEQGDCLAGGALVTIATHRRAARFFAGGWNRVSRWLRWMAGSFIFVEATAFREVGGFNEELFAGEELDLSEKLKRLARARNRSLVILTRHPLVTSGRKVELYTTWELLRFFLRASLARNRILRSREACHPWYDGRR